MEQSEHVIEAIPFGHQAIGMAVVRRRAEKKMEVHDSHRQKRFPPAEKETERLGMVGCGSKCV